MTSLQAFLLGLLQGLTEFFPVSSSSHLKVAEHLLGLAQEENAVLFHLMCHLGTLVAVLWFLRKEIVQLLTRDRQTLSLILIALIPLIPLYFLLKPIRDFVSEHQLFGLFLILSGILLFAANAFRLKRTESPSFKIRAQDALWIGSMQATALIPGISRSASTLSTAQLLGWKGSEAVRFSFLLSIPTIIGGSCLEAMKEFFMTKTSSSISFSSCLIGFLSSWGVGMMVIGYAMRLLEKGNLKPFAWYCLSLGLLITLYFNFYG